ncbi:MAG TPA: M48 family metallopeptidase [bacterium]|nr:M48 family metallopeptidase [bacterium]
MIVLRRYLGVPALISVLLVVSISETAGACAVEGADTAWNFSDVWVCGNFYELLRAGASRNKALGEYVGFVGRKLVAILPAGCRARSARFMVVDDEEPTARLALGRIVQVTVGMLRRMDSEADLAAVLSHEIGHACALQGLSLLPLDSANLDSARTSQFTRRLQRDQLNADSLGLRYLVAAGYEPAAALRMLERVQETCADISYGPPDPQDEDDLLSRCQAVARLIAEIPPEHRPAVRSEWAFRSVMNLLLPPVSPTDQSLSSTLRR